MYRLISKSKLKSAERFEEWVFDEVLPTIRKTGQYGKPQLPKSTEAQIQLLAQGTSELYNRVGVAESRIAKLEDTMTLDYGQQAVLGETVNKRVIDILGGKNSPAYKAIGRKVFAECNGDLKHYFHVNARANVPKRQYEEAIHYAEGWRPCTNTMMLINEHNAQLSIQ